jgi:hypothetical protein
MEEFEIPWKLIRMAKIIVMGSVIQMRVQSTLSEPLKVNNGLRQGDPLVCFSFNVALKKAAREANIQITGHVFNKSVQTLACADDVDIVTGSKAVLIQAFLALESAANRMGLSVN